MKAEMDTNTKEITLTAEDDADIYALGRLAQITGKKATKYPQEKHRLELSVADLLNAALGKQ